MESSREQTPRSSARNLQMRRLAGKVAIVTGGSSGMGAAIARRFAAEGAVTWIFDIRNTPSTGPSDRTHFLEVDVSRLEDVEAGVAHVAQEAGRLDIMCNNAGILSYGDTPSTSDELWRRVMSVDLDGVFYGSKAALPYLAKPGGGTVINVASIAGMGGFANLAAYSAAKAAVINFTKSFAIDHAHQGVRCNVICPGLIETPMTKTARADEASLSRTAATVPLGRWGQPEEIASVAAFLASDDAAYVTGVVIPVDGGISSAVRMR